MQNKPLQIWSKADLRHFCKSVRARSRKIPFEDSTNNSDAVFCTGVRVKFDNKFHTYITHKSNETLTILW